MPLAPGSRLGSYHVLSLIGEGGMGEVYRARDTRLQRDVALKTLHPSFVADGDRVSRFEREAQALASFNHPNIAQIYGVEESGGVHALVMELVPGKTLDEMILSPKPEALSLEGVLAIVRQIIAALEAAHEHGIIHRDLKPANIKVTEDGTVKVLDFGLAKVLVPGDSAGASGTLATMTSPAVTAMGMILGTAAYMAPEQARGRPVDKRADIWAFGCVLYEMLTGRQTFPGDNVTDVLAAVVKEEPDWSALPANTPRAVRLVLQRCLKKDPKQRLHDIADARIELDTGDLSGAGLDQKVTAPIPPPNAVRAAVIAAIAALGVGAAAGVWWRGGRDQAPMQWTAERLGGPAIALAPRISPDGNLLAFQAVVDRQSQAAVMKPGSGNWTVLTHDRSRGLVNVVTWSADGSRLYYDRYTDAPNGIYTVPALGGDEQLLIENASDPVPLKDGSVLFSRTNSARQNQLHQFWPGTGRISTLPAITNSLVRQLSDRRVVLVGRPLADAGGTDRLYILALESGEMRPIASGVSMADARSLAVDPRDDSILIAVVDGSAVRLLRLDAADAKAPQSVMTFLSRPLIDVDPSGALYASVTERPTEILRLRASGPPELMPTTAGLGGGTVALADGRLLSSSRTGTRRQAFVVTSDKEPRPFVQTDEETDEPYAPIGRDRVALRIGASSAPEIAIVASDNGRILSRLKAPVGLTSLGASPDGKTLYAAANGQISALPVAGGAARQIGSGDSFAVDPDSGDLIVKLNELERYKLVRLSPAGGPPKPIETKGDLRLIGEPLLAGSVKNGQLVVPVATVDSWFWFIGLLELASGRLERVPLDYPSDFHFASWAPDGRIVATGVATHGGLWKFAPAVVDGRH